MKSHACSTKPEFEQQIQRNLAEVDSISYNLHPPMLRRFGFKRKMNARLMVPDTAENPGVDESACAADHLTFFSYSAHRRQERALIDWYRGLIEQVLAYENPACASGTCCFARPDPRV